MIQHVRTLITGSYNLLHTSPDFAFIKAATSKAEHIDDDFLRLTKELAMLKVALRQELGKLSGIIEQIDGVVDDLKLLIERKEQNIKNLKTKLS